MCGVYGCAQYWCVGCMGVHSIGVWGVWVCTAKQWNPSNDTNKAEESVLLEMCPQFRGILIEWFMKNIILVISNPCRDKDTHSLSLPLLPLSAGIFWDWSGECQEDNQVPGGCLNFELSSQHRTNFISLLLLPMCIQSVLLAD